MVLPRCCICVSLLLMATSCPRKVEAAEKTSMFDSINAVSFYDCKVQELWRYQQCDPVL